MSTSIRFGNNHIGQRNQVLRGLKQGSVYQRHPHCQKLQIALIHLGDVEPTKVNQFVTDLREQLSNFGFDSNLIEQVVLSPQQNFDALYCDLELALGRVAEMAPNLILGILPEWDQEYDDQASGSLYHFAYNFCLSRKIASQFIFDSTLKKQATRHILNQMVPGILAKLGNLPFVLAEPLEIADAFVGFDVSRAPKKNGKGSINVCGSLCVYGSRGEFIRSYVKGDHIEGEEIPRRMIDRLTPQENFGQRRVLIYRDGPFRGQEVEHLLQRAKAIGAAFILVACVKSRVPRLYQSSKTALYAPAQGQGLMLSPWEAILVTTAVKPQIGIAQPLRLTLHPQGHPAPMDKILEATLKLTLLHHGALQTTRLPLPLYGADLIAYLHLRGISLAGYPNDRQYWL